MNILLVDDHAILIDGVEALLKTRPDIFIAGKVQSAQFAIAALKAQQIDLMITDYSMPDMNGLELIRAAKKINPSLKIIVLSMHDERAIAQEMISEGIDAYILKKHTHHELLQALDIVISGGHFWSKDISKMMVMGFTRTEEEYELTERELEVLRLLCAELTSKSIAEKLFISERTVETHRKNLLRKTASSSTVGLIKYAYSKKLL